jgi:uncharacterized membrane protein
MKSFLYVVGALHSLFALCELFPWSSPVLLRVVGRKLPAGDGWSVTQQPLVATIVHNAGIYNAVLAGGLFWAAAAGDPGRDVARVLLAGAAVAGAFGTATLRSPLTALQGVLGLVGFALVSRSIA